MDDYASSDEDYHYDSDQEDSVEAYENDENYALLSSKGTTTKVYDTPFWGYSNFYSSSSSSYVKNPHLLNFLLAMIYVRVCLCVWVFVFLFFYYCIGL